MKGIVLPLFSALLLFSCQKGNDLPHAETISKGSKWGLTIGSSPEDVYTQLQKQGIEKDFSQVAVVGRQPFSKPQDVENLLTFYDAITLESNSGVIDRVIMEFRTSIMSTMLCNKPLFQIIIFYKPFAVLPYSPLQTCLSITTRI